MDESLKRDYDNFLNDNRGNIETENEDIYNLSGSDEDHKTVKKKYENSLDIKSSSNSSRYSHLKLTKQSFHSKINSL